MYIKFGRVRIHVGFPFAAFCAYAANSGTGKKLILVFVSALLHEAGHAAALACCGDKTLTLSLSPGGAKIKSRLLSGLPYEKDLAVAAAGPAVSLVLAALLFIVRAATGKRDIDEAAGMNLALGVVNLLPLSFLDGGRIMYDALVLRISDDSARRISSRCDTAVFVLLAALLILLTAIGENTVYLAVFAVYCAVQKTVSGHLQ